MMPVLVSRIVLDDGTTYDRVTEATTGPTAAKKAIAAAEEAHDAPLGRYVFLAAEVSGEGADFMEMLREFDGQEAAAREAFGLDADIAG